VRRLFDSSRCTDSHEPLHVLHVSRRERTCRRGLTQIRERGQGLLSHGRSREPFRSTSGTREEGTLGPERRGGRDFGDSQRRFAQQSFGIRELALP
jgi:hypothetical protein